MSTFCYLLTPHSKLYSDIKNSTAATTEDIRKTNGLAKIANTKIIAGSAAAAKKNIKKTAAPSPPSIIKSTAMNSIPVIMRTSVEGDDQN